MQVYIIILSAYGFYFLGNILYDGFIAKPKISKVGEGEEEPIFVLEDQEHIVDENQESQTINFDSIENADNDDIVNVSEIEEKTDEEVQTDLNESFQEEENFTFDLQEEQIPNEENDKSFISDFKKFLNGNNFEETTSQFVEEDLDVLSILNNSTKITSYSYANAQIF